MAAVGDGKYVDWLWWIHSTLRPGGLFIALENGAGSMAVRAARRIGKSLGRYVARSPLDERRLHSLESIFVLHHVVFAGRWAPLVGEVRPLRRAVAMVDRVCPPTARSSFVTGVVAERR